MLNSTRKIAKYLGFSQILFVICAFIAIISIVFVCTHINYFQIDFGWHIASSTMFARYGFHNWNPSWFHGFINNLFYPPLEDALVSLLYSLTHLSHVYSFVFYTSLVILFYWFGVYTLISSLKSRIFALFLFLFLCLYFFLDKSDNITYFQWASFFDLLFTGLTSENLWIGFFLFFIVEYMKDTTNPWKLWIFAILSLLSHMVVGPVVFLVWALRICVQYTRKHLYAFLLSIWVTSFFWIPFLLSKWSSISSLIAYWVPILLTLVSLWLAILAYKYKFFASFGLLFASTLLILLNYFSLAWTTWISTSSLLPVFHYYRFASIALLCTIIGAVFLFDKFYQKASHSETKNNIVILWSTFFIISISLLVLHFGVLTFSRLDSVLWGRANQYTDTKHIPEVYSLMNDQKKIFTIDIYRPIDFGLDSYFQYMTPWLPFVKWLFWESARWNQLLSSYISTLLSPQYIVLDFYTAKASDQSQYNTLWDGFIHQYTIGWIMIAPMKKLSYLDSIHKAHLYSTFTSWTSLYTFVLADHIVIQGVDYDIYKIVPKNTIKSSAFIHFLSPATTLVPLVNHSLFADQILNLYRLSPLDTATDDYLFFDIDKLPIIPLSWLTSSSLLTYSSGSRPNTYTIHIGDTAKAVVIHLPDLPWWTFTSLQWKDLSVFDGLYEKVIISSGDVLLSYQKPFSFILAYILSLVSGLIFVYYYWKHK